jgi:hypothetical protein
MASGSLTTRTVSGQGQVTINHRQSSGFKRLPSTHADGIRLSGEDPIPNSRFLLALSKLNFRRTLFLIWQIFCQCTEKKRRDNQQPAVTGPDKRKLISMFIFLKWIVTCDLATSGCWWPKTWDLRVAYQICSVFIKITIKFIVLSVFSRSFFDFSYTYLVILHKHLHCNKCEFIISLIYPIFVSFAMRDSHVKFIHRTRSVWWWLHMGRCTKNDSANLSHIYMLITFC